MTTFLVFCFFFLKIIYENIIDLIFPKDLRQSYVWSAFGGKVLLRDVSLEIGYFQTNNKKIFL